MSPLTHGCIAIQKRNYQACSHRFHIELNGTTYALDLLCTEQNLDRGAEIC